MNKNIQYNLADTVLMKKPHACKINNWEILRLGADIRLKCMGCGHIVLMPRSKFVHNFKKILAKANDPVNLKNEQYELKNTIVQPNLIQDNK
ncbi:hypothetical protein SAMN04487792_1365 [Lactobacillus bombicola]|jgi:hypothetical protein|uniref:DUF951 domain-containing protein n=1 Tax=Lactobacillus bombicola TaxID=1505723 RepID=A0A1I1TJD1_9LACO|nr:MULTISPECIES: DUF951 domain-containing protein [Lactobacillus]MCO6528436.1 DUF951 domain-containing protein [Lactobacillus sp.]RHW49448.1 DUF951 domain-containing protein [Lactobacillus bombicola]RHW49509.1 DUF951 domain-containing protein [Lactobacillus bombicola]RHW53324.1 DUF951 domain-containing protein [Lactobacillus bombicola]RMC41894.1 DUF951 domain-containing protein [Lactobacillus sp. ESL0237]